MWPKQKIQAQALSRVPVRLFAVRNKRDQRLQGPGEEPPALVISFCFVFFWWQDLPASRAQPESAAGHRGEGILGPGQDREDQGQQESHQGSKRVALSSGWSVVPKVLFFLLSPCLRSCRVPAPATRQVSPCPQSPHPSPRLWSVSGPAGVTRRRVSTGVLQRQVPCPRASAGVRLHLHGGPGPRPAEAPPPQDPEQAPPPG